MLNALLVAPVDPALAVGTAREELAEWRQNRSPVFAIVVAIAIVVGLGIIAYLTAVCINRGYHGFGAIVDIDKKLTHWKVKFTCI